MKLNLLLSSAAIGLVAVAAQAGTITPTKNGDLGGNVTGALDIQERIERGNGVYNVMNNTTGSLSAFGVSNNGSLGVLYNHDGFGEPFESCTGNICYDVTTIGVRNWNDIAYTDSGSDEAVGLTFQFLFGDFATASGGDNVFHWYTATDGSLNAGAAQDNFFGFSGLDVASSIIGIATSGTGATAFTAGQAVPPSAVPLPAAGLLLLAGLGGLGAASRRKKA